MSLQPPARPNNPAPQTTPPSPGGYGPTLPSYTNKAIVALVLTWLLWIPGVIANVMFLNEAKADEKKYGQSLPGVGCLTALIWIQIIGTIIFVVLIFAVCSAAASA